MRNSNTIELIGYVHQDARCPNEATYPDWVVFKVCVNRKYKNKQGEIQEHTSWYECKTSSPSMAKICKQYVKDKMGVLVRGIPKAKAYTDSQGHAQASIEVLVTDLNILTYPKSTDSNVSPTENGRFKIGENKPSEPEAELYDDEIPF